MKVRVGQTFFWTIFLFFLRIYGVYPRVYDPQSNPFSLKLIPPSKMTPPFTRHFQKKSKKI
jgi:hypothetical protein